MVDDQGNAVLVDACVRHHLEVHLARQGAIPENWRYLPASDVQDGRHVSDYSRDVYAFGNLVYEVKCTISFTKLH
jgi:hypothetical protein